MKDNKHTPETIRCAQCQRKLAEATNYQHLSIKCPRCRVISNFSNQEHQRAPKAN